MKIPSDVIQTIVEGFKRNSILVSSNIENGTVPGDNFMSVLYSLHLEIKEKNSDIIEKLSVMLKCLPVDPLCSTIVEDCNSFAKEAGMYMRIFRNMTAFQESKGFLQDDLFQAWPNAYAIGCDDFKFLAMQDLRVDGYKMMDRQKLFDVDHTKIVLQSLARFHSLSLAMFHGEYDVILQSYPFLEERMFREPSEVSVTQRKFVNMAFASVSSILHNAGEYEAKELWDSFNEDLHYFEYMHELVGTKPKCAVITFGDCWKNNILFKEDNDENSGTNTEVKFVDFQLARVSARATDVSYFLYTSVEMSVIDEMEGELLQFYHDELKSFLKRLGIIPKNVGCTWKKFQKEYEKYRLYGVILGIMLTPALYSNSKSPTDGGEEPVDSNNVADCNTDNETNFRNSDVTKRICMIAKNHLQIPI